MYDTNRSGRKRALFFCSTLLLGSLANVHGQGTTNEISKTKVTIPEIVVTATRDQRLVKDAPYSTSILGANTLRLETPVRTVPEALKTAPGTMVQKTGHGQGSPYIRGFTGYRFPLCLESLGRHNHRLVGP